MTDGHEPRDEAAPAGWSAEFHAWADQAIADRDVDVLIAFLHKAPAAIAHPRTEHFAPLFVSLGASTENLTQTAAVIDGFWYGLSKRSWQFD